METEKDAPQGWAHTLLEFVLAVGRRFFEDRSVQTAGSLTFTTLLSIVPLLTVALSMTTAFPVFEESIGALQRYVIDNYLPNAQGIEAIGKQINEFTQKAGRLTAIGLAVLALTALMLMLTIDEVMNRVFRVQRRRPLAQRVLMYWSVLTLGPVLIGASLSMTSFVVGASLGVLNMDWLTSGVLRLMPFLFTLAALTLLYLVVPFRRIEAHHALVGALLAGIAFEATKRGFALYIEKFPTYSLIYGAFATVPIFLLWLYLSWLVVLAGATVTAMLPAYHGVAAERSRAPGQGLLDAIAILSALARAQTSGGVQTLTQITRSLRLLPYRCERVLDRCTTLGWVARTERDGWLLARDAASIRVADVYRAFVLDANILGSRGPTRLEDHARNVEVDLNDTLADLVAEAGEKS